MQGMCDRSHSKSHQSSTVAKGEAEEVMPTETEVREKGVFWEDGWGPMHISQGQLRMMRRFLVWPLRWLPGKEP